MPKFTSFVLSLVLSFAAFVPAVRADTTIFENGFYFISTPTEFDDVIVGERAIVTFLEGVVITGDLEIIDGGFASVNDCVVEGDIKANGAAIVDLLRVSIGGNVQIKRTGGDPVLGLLPLISVILCDIEGNVQIMNNNVNSITYTGNVVGRNVQIMNNHVNLITYCGNLAGGKVQIRNNRIKSTHSCK